jgi:hypothetical protein
MVERWLYLLSYDSKKNWVQRNTLFPIKRKKGAIGKGCGCGAHHLLYSELLYHITLSCGCTDLAELRIQANKWRIDPMYDFH